MEQTEYHFHQGIPRLLLPEPPSYTKNTASFQRGLAWQVIQLPRVRRNRHHWGDIIVGAGLGVLGTHAGYWLGDKLTGEKSRYVVGVTEDGITLMVCL